MFPYPQNRNDNYCTPPSLLTPHLCALSQRHRKPCWNNNPQLESSTFPHYPIFSPCYLKTSRTPEAWVKEQVGNLRCVKEEMTSKCNTKRWRAWLHFVAQPRGSTPSYIQSQLLPSGTPSNVHSWTLLTIDMNAQAFCSSSSPLSPSPRYCFLVNVLLLEFCRLPCKQGVPLEIGPD